MRDRTKIKVLFLTLSVLLLISELYAQNWINEDARWYHGASTALSSGYVRMEYAGDTLLNGAETGAVFKRTYYQYGWMGELEVTTGTSLIFRESDATLYLWNESLSSFDTLIQFGAAPGDTWWTTTDYDEAGEESMSTTVIDTGHIEINAASLPWMHVEYQFDYFDMTYTEHDTIVEGIGPLEHYMLPWEAVYLSGVTGGLRCFESSNIGLYSRSGQGESCDAILTNTEELTAYEEHRSTVYPNPATDEIHFSIRGNKVIDRVAIFDLDGQSVAETVLQGRQPIAVRELAKGIYVVAIVFEDGSTGRARFVKQ